ncbi:MAG: UTP--glucose-1-phosphate uridylyltransferase [Myxococcota bacterium]
MPGDHRLESRDPELLERLCAWVRGGARPPQANFVDFDVNPPREPPVAVQGASRYRIAQWAGRGESALQSGRVARVVLNGGMATRFGGGAKGVVPVVPERPDASFLACIVASAYRFSVQTPVVLMHGEHTAEPSEAHLQRLDWLGLAPQARHRVIQPTLPRLDPDGQPLTPADAPWARASTGHGALVRALRETGLGQTLLQRGVQTLFVSNVDNVGACLDPVLLGFHLAQVDRGAAMTAEAIARPAERVGSFIAAGPRGWPVVIEDFRLDPVAAARPFTHCSINNLWIELPALLAAPPLAWHLVPKTIDADGGSRPVLQFEQLVGQLSDFLPTAVIEVGAERFLPIKSRSDLHTHRERLEQIVAQRLTSP